MIWQWCDIIYFIINAECDCGNILYHASQWCVTVIIYFTMYGANIHLKIF